MSRYLITGATGFIGGHLAEKLVDRGVDVRCLIRETSDTSLLDPLGVEFVKAGLHDRDLLNEAVRDVIGFTCFPFSTNQAKRPMSHPQKTTGSGISPGIVACLVEHANMSRNTWIYLSLNFRNPGTDRGPTTCWLITRGKASHRLE